MENENYYKEVNNLPFAIKALQYYYKYIGKFFPTLSGWIFWKLFSLPKKRKTREKHQNFLATANSKKINFEKFAIQTYEWGESNKKILIVHGWEGMSADFLEVIQELTNSGFSVVAIDLPAHGKSTGKRTHLPMVIRLVKEVISKHGPFYGVVAHSLGASATAFGTAQLNGESNLSKMALLGLHPVPFAFFEQFRQVLKIDTPLFEKCVLYVQHKVNIKIREASVYDITSLISAPQILLVHDEQDEVANINNIKRLNKEWDKSELFTGKHGGHFRHYKHPDVVSKLVKFFES